MPKYLFHTLGFPVVSSAETSEQLLVRFRYRDTWLLMGSLFVDPNTNRREALALRLGFDQMDGRETPRDKMRIRLNDLRHGAPVRGTEGGQVHPLSSADVYADRETISVSAEAIQTDLQIIERALDAVADRSTTLQERVFALQRAATLLRGPFFEGFDVERGDGWLEAMRFKSERLTVAVWHQLALALRSTGQRRAAFDAARKAYLLHPDAPEILELFLDLADGSREREEILSLSRSLGIDDLVPRLAALEKEGQPLHVSEENALGVAVRSRLSQLSAPLRECLLTLSCFPASFTPELAIKVASVSALELRRLVQAFPFEVDGDSYRLLPPIRTSLHELTRPTVRVRFLEIYDAWFYRLVVEEEEGKAPDPEYWFDLARSNASHLVFTLRRVASQPISPRGITYAHHLWVRCKTAPDVVAALQDVREYLEQVAGSDLIPGRYHAHCLLGGLAMERRDFREAVSWYRRLLAESDYERHATLLKALEAAHHARDDDYFQQAAREILQDLAACPPELAREIRHRVPFLIAENKLALRQFEEGLTQNRIASEVLLGYGVSLNDLPVHWNQRASLYLGLNDRSEAARCWEMALRGFQEQNNRGGVAECFAGIGSVLLQEDSIGLGLSLLYQAIELFRSLSNSSAVVATQGKLGDYYLNLGDVSRARSLFAAGLAYWKEQGHERWIAIFEERLMKLAQAASEKEAHG